MVLNTRICQMLQKSLQVLRPTTALPFSLAQASSIIRPFSHVSQAGTLWPLLSDDAI